MSFGDRAEGREESQRAQKELREAKRQEAIPKGFIEVTLPADNEKQLINIHTINLVRSVIWDEATHTMLLLASAPFRGAPAGVPSELEVSETYEQIKALLKQAA